MPIVLHECDMISHFYGQHTFQASVNRVSRELLRPEADNVS